MLNLKKLLTKILTTPMVIEQGTSGIWTYRKWSDGTAECWGRGMVNGTWSAWGNVYYLESPFAFPFTFASAPVVQAWAPSMSTINLNSVMSVGSYSARDESYQRFGCNLALIRPSAGTNNADYAVHIYVIGKWK